MIYQGSVDRSRTEQRTSEEGLKEIFTIILIDSLSLMEIWSFSRARNVWVKPWIDCYFDDTNDIQNVKIFVNILSTFCQHCVNILSTFVNLLRHQTNRQPKFLLFVARPVHWMHSSEVDCCQDMTVSLAPSTNDSLIVALLNLADMSLWALLKLFPGLHLRYFWIQIYRTIRDSQKYYCYG